MIENFIRYAIIGVVVSLMMSFFKKASKANPAQNIDGNDVLKMPLLYGIIGVVAFIPGLAIFVYALIDFNPDVIWIQLFLFLLFGGLGGVLILQQWVAKVILTEEEIIKITMFGQQRNIRWGDIVSVKFGSISKELKIQSKETKIKCHIDLVGFVVLVSKLEEETGLTVEQMGITH